MAKEWEPKEEHQAVIARSIEFISDELAELQEALHCPNSFIVAIANKVVSEYKTNTIIIRRDEEEATSLVVLSTIIALISIPVWLMILRL